jgi:hypothetical protein
MEAALVIVLAGVAVSGYLLRSAWALVVPLLAIPAVYLGLDQGWWGAGLGDGWQFAMLTLLALGLALAGAGIAARRALRALRRERP